MRAADFFKSDEGEKYLKIFQEKIFVVKYGGAALEEESMMEYFLEDVAEMNKQGIHILLVHGGGKMLSVEMQKRNLPVEFVGGMRKTTPEAAELAREVFADLNEKICQKLIQFGGPAIGFTHGRAVKAKLLDVNNPANRVGEVDSVDSELLDFKQISVVSSIGKNTGPGIPEGAYLNINADLVAMAIAEKIKASKLVFISDVNGIYLDHTNPDTKLSHVTEAEIQDLIARGVLHGGMKLKVEMALKALKGGVNKVHFLDGRIQHSLMYEIFTDKGIGTEIVHNF
jgi:acetylglutamate kinase